MSLANLGMLADGRAIREAALATEAGAEARIMELGAVLRDLIVPLGDGGRQRVVLGFGALETYEGRSQYAGAIAGRCANRIAHGRFAIDGRSFQLPLNEGSRHSLHGGAIGFDRHAWSIVEHGADAVTLALVSPAGDQGYPGALRVWCRYALIEPATLTLDLTAITDEATVVNLAQHSYFNLDGSDDVRDHEMMVAADFYTPTDAELIPTGEILSVAGTPFDFRSARPIRHVPAGASTPFGYDMNFVLRRSSVERSGGLELAQAATIRSRRNGLVLELWTTEPGLQVYDCHNMNLAARGHEGRHHGAGAGLALEAQLFPDSPNRAHFPSAVLRPGEIYRQRTEYRFAAESFAAESFAAKSFAAES
ncbi:MAG: aldose epimerase family protein [Hyphomicrobiales bacterium]